MIGFLNIYKPTNTNSTYVVSVIKKLLKLKKVGHMGTLDPMAEGVLPIAIGNATRMFDYFLFKRKTYIATFEFGYETDTLDAQGKIVSSINIIPNKGEIVSILPQLIGILSQLPPKYSAKNVNGKRAYDLARENIDFELKPKDIEIFSIKMLEQLNNATFSFEIECSSGTYIRSICRDIAYKLNSLATMVKLIRTKSGKFTVENSINLNELNEQNIKENILKIDSVFDLEKINLEEKDAVKLKNGMSILYNTNDKDVFVEFNNELLGVGQVINKILKLKTHF